MNSLYNHGVKQTQLITKDLSSFEKNVSTSPLSLQGSISTSLNAFKKTIKEYNDLIKQNTNDANITKQETRLEKFNQDYADFNKKFQELKQQRESSIQESNRQELLGRRNHLSENPYDQTSGVSPNHQHYQQQDMSYQEGLYKESNSLARGSQQLDHILEMGQNAFDDIIEQNETLQKLGAGLEQGLLTLGVSQGTIRTIERRAKQDKWLFWGGVILMIICFYYILKFFR
ncbi:protein transport protein Bos1p [[Candida] jaroonii]|uniref:Protein transport protein Bos1p n=1 Tax=[Candida] jaroonii TaxID=467808 RepID=A0ACA9YAT3_9ASCO|nr:protein transport protein Bos1p [[Candida] jaroonii]